MDTTTSRYLNSAEVKSFLGGISDMTMWRLENDADAAFPKPIRINRRKLYDWNELRSWAANRRPEAA